MKTIGLIGGMSWESSRSYYEIINEETRRCLGGSASAECILYSCNFQRIVELQDAGEWDRLKGEIARLGASLKRAGADFIVLCTNTMHKVVEGFDDEVGLPLLHIADVVGERMKRDGVRKAGLLGTRFTMKERFYSDRIRGRFGVEMEIPAGDAIEEIDRVIFKELVRGEVRRSSRSFLEREIGELVERGCEGIVLGCTELGMLIESGPCRLYDSAVLHAKKAVELALAP